MFVISIKDGFYIGPGDLYSIVGAMGFSYYLIRVERYSLTNNIIPAIVPMFFTSMVIMLCIAVTEPGANWLPTELQFWPGILYCAFSEINFVARKAEQVN